MKKMPQCARACQSDRRVCIPWFTVWKTWPHTAWPKRKKKCHFGFK